MALSRREASIRPAHARRFRDHLGTDTVRSKLPPLCVPMSPSLVSREANRDCGARSDLRRWACLSCERRYKLIHGARKYNLRFEVHIQLKTNFIFPTLETRRDRSEGGSVQRGRRKAAELHTSGAKRYESVPYYYNVLS